jgi:hypothetical protein
MDNSDARPDQYRTPEFSDAEIAGDPILHYFHYSHLPPKLQSTSRLFFILAATLIRTLPRNPERTVALRKLLEGKDAAVRANLAPPPIGLVDLEKRYQDAQQTRVLDEPVEIGDHDEDRDGPIPFGD